MHLVTCTNPTLRPPGGGFSLRPPSWWRRAGALLCIAGALAFSSLSAATGPTKEYQIKALFLFNFIQFAEWPPSAFGDAASPIRIGVLGENPFGSELESVIRGEKVRQRALQIEYSNRPQDLQDCHLVFISNSERNAIPRVLAAFNGRPILTVGDMRDFAQRGGVINFYFEGQKVRFNINRAAAQASGIKLSSQLLSLARIVGPAPGKGDQ